MFISCGQNKRSDEVELAHKILKVLEGLGFEGYIAVREQVLRGVKENIFAQLASSEYFLFIDFKREAFRDSDECRGSLFSHQELAVAAYLDIDVLAFQEEGVRKQDGLLAYLQTNCIPFSKRADLPALVEAEVKTQGWSPIWKGTLLLDYMYHTDREGASGRPERHFLVGVMNQHRAKPARNCYVYLALIRYPHLEDTALYFTPMEIRWAGHPFPNVLLAPRWWRPFDAFVVDHNKPRRAEFQGFATSSEFGIPPVDSPSFVHLTYAVISDDFPIALATFSLSIGKTIEEIRFEKISLDPSFKDGWAPRYPPESGEPQ